jgi:hypothetical protein
VAVVEDDVGLLADMNPNQFLHRVLTDAAFFMEHMLWVRDKQTGLPIKFRLKPAQRRVVTQMQEEWDAGRPVRLIVLKARREGVSTAVQGFMFWACVTRQHRHAGTMSYDNESAGYLHGMVEFFYSKLPDWYLPMRRKARAGKVLEFANPTSDEGARRADPGLESSMSTISLESGGASRGFQLLHISELALPGWETEVGRKALRTILPTIPRAAETIVVIESTARGVGGQFYERWQNAEQALKEGAEGRFIPIFLPWFDEPTYRAETPSDFELTEQERDIAEMYSLDDEQIYWRRLTIAEDGNGDADWFRQEYPATPSEAFLTSGRPYFNIDGVGIAERQARSVRPIRRGYLTEYVHDRDGKRYMRLDEKNHGTLRVWEDPDPDESYFIFTDPSDGTTEGQADNDPQCAYVTPTSRLALVACWHGRTDRDVLGDQLYMLGRLYNDALIAVEVTGGWGMVPITVLKRRGYPRLWRRKRYAKRGVEQQDELGWETQKGNRPLMLDALNTHLREGTIEVNDPYLIGELRTFVYADKDGKPQALPGSYDDRVLAAAGAAWLWDTEPRIDPYSVVDRGQQGPRSLITGV